MNERVALVDSMVACLAAVGKRPMVAVAVVVVVGSWTPCKRPAAALSVLRNTSALVVLVMRVVLLVVLLTTFVPRVLKVVVV